MKPPLLSNFRILLYAENSPLCPPFTARSAHVSLECVQECQQSVCRCSKCKQLIVSGEGFGFVCFKIPGTESYRFFHRRFCRGERWEAYPEQGNAQSRA